MIITLHSFKLFKEVAENAELVTNNKFGIILFKDEVFTPTEISESDFEKYTHITVDSSDVVDGFISSHPAWPIVAIV